MARLCSQVKLSIALSLSCVATRRNIPLFLFLFLSPPLTLPNMSSIFSPLQNSSPPPFSFLSVLRTDARTRERTCVSEWQDGEVSGRCFQGEEGPQPAGEGERHAPVLREDVAAEARRAVQEPPAGGEGDAGPEGRSCHLQGPGCSGRWAGSGGSSGMGLESSYLN